MFGTYDVMGKCTVPTAPAGILEALYPGWNPRYKWFEPTAP